MANTKTIPLLKSETLTVGYLKGKKQLVVLENLNLILDSGEMVCLLGPNGVGKSTLIRTISGVQKHLNGKIYLQEKLVSSYNKADLAKIISLVLTEKIPGGNLDVFNLVALGRYPYTGWIGNLSKEDLLRVEWSIEITAIDQLRKKQINELSDGELQKVMIARALAQDGKILILDEPTAHLDLSNRVEIMDLLKNLALETGKAILVSTHDLDLALQTADKLWLISGKNEIFTGSPEDLILNGKIAKTFQKKSFSFDVKTGFFKIKRNLKNTAKLNGKGIALKWTAHALERIGFAIVENAQIEISVLEENQNILWKLKGKNNQYFFKSIEELTEHLKLFY
ncbi:ABC transporter ATP-binding protein [soil metagenome]